MNGSRRSLLRGAIASGAAVFGLGSAKAASISGVWGGPTAVLTLDGQGGHLDFGCGYATLTSPVSPDSQGRFKVTATFFSEPTGLVDADKPPAQVESNIEGTFTGESLHLSFKPSGAVARTFDLVAGKRYKLFRCV